MDKISLKKSGRKRRGLRHRLSHESEEQGYEPKVEWLRKRFAEGCGYLLFAMKKADRWLSSSTCRVNTLASGGRQGLAFVHCCGILRRTKRAAGQPFDPSLPAEARKAKAIGVAAMVSDGLGWRPGGVSQERI